ALMSLASTTIGGGNKASYAEFSLVVINTVPAKTELRKICCKKKKKGRPKLTWKENTKTLIQARGLCIVDSQDPKLTWKENTKTLIQARGLCIEDSQDHRLWRFGMGRRQQLSCFNVLLSPPKKPKLIQLPPVGMSAKQQLGHQLRPASSRLVN
ncbi:hypothetical protein L9F63_015067, partial [Diploptera punctata]